jgi:outer membrane murein-binding lipoprotein Lpp
MQETLHCNVSTYLKSIPKILSPSVLGYVGYCQKSAIDMNKIKVLVIAGILVTIVWGSFFSQTASSQQVESRINNLEADFNRVESRLNQIESQLGQSRQSPSPRTTLTPRQSTSFRGNLSQQDRMLDRLATLVVELKQQVNELKERVAKLESR